jgi:hypothetical protein
LQQGGPDIACHGHTQPGTLDQVIGHGGGGGFDVGSGNGQQFGRVSMFTIQISQRLNEKIKLTLNGNSLLGCKTV